MANIKHKQGNKTFTIIDMGQKIRYNYIYIEERIVLYWKLYLHFIKIKLEI